MNWLRAIEDAPSVDAVLEVVNEFLAERTDDFWAHVPGIERLESIASDAELHKWHQELVQVITRTRTPHMDLQELCVFFLRASVRVHRITLKAQGSPDSSNDRSFSAAGLGKRIA